MSKIPIPKSTSLKNYTGCSYITNVSKSNLIMKKLSLDKVYQSDLKILDVYSNNLVFSSVLHNHLLPNQHVLMESRKDYSKFTQEFIKTLEPNKIEFVDLNPFSWKSYLAITGSDKILDPGFESRDHIHSKFLFTAAVAEEGLIMQWLACLGHQNWIQRFGNVKMLLWIPEATAIKLLAPAGSPARAKCSVVTETFSNTKLIAVHDTPKLEKFSPTVLERDEPIMLSPKDFSTKHQMSLVEVDPKHVELDDIYSWDYVTKNLMILKQQKLRDSLKNLGPGADYYFPSILPKELLEKPIKSLSSEELLQVTKIFDQWPFKPESLFEFLRDDRD